MHTSYPQYRKLVNNKSFYKIASDNVVIEIQLSGSRWQKHEIHARILPEKLLVLDLLAADGSSYVKIEEAEYFSAEQQMIASGK